MAVPQGRCFPALSLSLSSSSEHTMPSSKRKKKCLISLQIILSQFSATTEIVNQARIHKLNTIYMMTVKVSFTIFFWFLFLKYSLSLNANKNLLNVMELFGKVILLLCKRNYLFTSTKSTRNDDLEYF